MPHRLEQKTKRPTLTGAVSWKNRLWAQGSTVPNRLQWGPDHSSWDCRVSPDTLRRLASRVKRGEHHWASRLDAVQVQAMRARFALGDSIKAIAIDAGFDYSHVWRVVHRKVWTHVP